MLPPGSLAFNLQYVTLRAKVSFVSKKKVPARTEQPERKLTVYSKNYRADMMERMFNAAPSEIAYFCQDVEWISDDAFTFTDEDDNAYTVTKDQFRKATYVWAEWAGEHYAGKESRFAQYQRKAAQDWRFDVDGFDYDGNTVDMIAQVAAYGKIVFG